MKKIISYIGLFLAVNVAAASLVVSPISQTNLASDMVNDTSFSNNVISADKSSMTNFTFDGLTFTEQPSFFFSAYSVSGPMFITVDYLGKSSADKNNLLANLGLGDELLFEHYGVVDDQDDSVQIEIMDGFNSNLTFWNQDATKGIDGTWDNPDHFKVYSSATTGGAELLFLAVDDRGSSQPGLQDWNDGSFLVTTFSDATQVAIPEPSMVAPLTALYIMGILMRRRRK